MRRVLIFGGTTEGREIADRLRRAGDDVVVSVTGEYAKALLPTGVRCHARALDAPGMLALVRTEAPDLIVDATHPFAAEASRNIEKCARAAGIVLERVTRPGGGTEDWRDAVEWVEDPAGAVEALKRTDGNALLTTGSHTLFYYLRALPRERLYARVLPESGVIAVCEAMGVLPGHLIAMQGPFSRALNAALYDQLSIRVLVSKDSGEAGGVGDKVLPALERGIHVIVIRRPDGPRGAKA